LVLSGLVASTGRCSPISPAFPYTTALPIFQPYQIRKPAIRRYLKRKRSRRRRRIRPSGARSLPSALWVSLTLDHPFVPGGAVAGASSFRCGSPKGPGALLVSEADAAGLGRQDQVMVGGNVLGARGDLVEGDRLDLPFAEADHDAPLAPGGPLGRFHPQAGGQHPVEGRGR